MDSLLTFARGPLFVTTFLFMILGLLRQIYLALYQYINAYRNITNKPYPMSKDIRSLFDWLIPLGHIYRTRPILSSISFIFHVGVIITPIFLLQHIFLFKRGFGISWWGIPTSIADILTIVTVICVSFLFIFRILDGTTRAMSSFMDYVVLIVIGLPFLSGFLALHPLWNPFSYNSTMLIHILCAELLFVLLPYTKLVHMVLFPFDRLSSNIFWQLPVGAGEKVAKALHGEEVRV